MAEPILIWGAGAIGGTLGAYWARAGHEVILVDTVAEHVAACRSSHPDLGLAIEGPIDTFRLTIPAYSPDELSGSYATIVLAVKAQHTEAALAMLAPHLTNDGCVLSAQNGLNEMLISRAIGAERTVGCFVNFSADWHGPGQIMYGNRGAVVVGELDGKIRPRTRELYDLLAQFEPNAVLTDDIWAYLWGKLVYGAMLFATALNNDSMAENFADRQRRDAWVALGREVMAVATARGVQPRGFNGFDPTAFSAHAPLALAHDSIAALAEFNRDNAKTHSGVWRDLAVRKRRTEVDVQIDIITKLGHEVGIDTPALCCLVTLIHDIENGKRVQSAETLEVLLDVCSSI